MCGISLECVSKCREMQFRGHQVAFQGEKPQAYWLQVKASGILETHSRLFSKNETR